VKLMRGAKTAVVIAASTGLALVPATMSQAAGPHAKLPAVVRTAAPHAHKATLKTFAGSWFGHTRDLKITRKGHAKESISDGCCDPVITLRFRVSDVRGTVHKASARVKVTVVHVHDRSAYPKGTHPPHKGEVRRIRLKKGVITERLTKTNYCDTKADKTGVCGA
jgi:hypothetical protein